MDYTTKVANAIHHFWTVRSQQQKNQGMETGKKNHGNRGAVTGGKHLDGFISLFSEIILDAGLAESSIHTRMTRLPGYFRPTKAWDLVVVVDGRLLATIEFKAQVGSFGNNFNNRIEEALGSSTDLLTAYREGKFKPSQKPWMGWLMLLEDSPKSTVPVRLNESHFEVFSEFKNTSYAKRYEIFCERMLRERLYDAACFIMSNEDIGRKGGFIEPNQELTFKAFATSLLAHLMAFVKMNMR